MFFTMINSDAMNVFWTWPGTHVGEFLQILYVGVKLLHQKVWTLSPYFQEFLQSGRIHQTSGYEESSWSPSLVIVFYCPTFTFPASLVSIKWQIFLVFNWHFLSPYEMKLFFFFFWVIEASSLVLNSLCVSNTSQSIWWNSLYMAQARKGREDVWWQPVLFSPQRPRRSRKWPLRIPLYDRHGSRWRWWRIWRLPRFGCLLWGGNQISARKTWVFLISCWTRQFNQGTMNILLQTYLIWPICS